MVYEYSVLNGSSYILVKEKKTCAVIDKLFDFTEIGCRVEQGSNLGPYHSLVH